MPCLSALGSSARIITHGLARASLLGIALVAACSSPEPATAPEMPTAAVPSETPPPAPPAAEGPEPTVESPAAPTLPAEPGIYLRRGEAWEPTVVRIRDPFLGTYAGTTGMRSADLPICPSPCRFLIVNMPAIDTTALFRSAPTRHVVVGAPASRYPWRADPNLDHPITVHVVAPSAYEFEVPASPGSGSFDLAAIVARQGDLEGRAVFFIIRRGG